MAPICRSPRVSRNSTSRSALRLLPLPPAHHFCLSMLRPRSCGTVRLLDRFSRPVTRPQNLHLQFLQFSSLPTRSAPTPTPSSSAQPDSFDRVPLRKQLKQDAKALKAQKRQRKEGEEASREIWELTVGVEIHAQLDTTAKLFSRMYHPVHVHQPTTHATCSTSLTYSFLTPQVLPHPRVIFPIPMSPCST